MFIRFVLMTICLLPIATSMGCDRGIKVVPVTGKVTLDGKPLPFKSLYFYPDRSVGTQGNGAGGFTDPDSRYYLTANLGGETSDTRGAPPGKYRVTVSEPAVPLNEDSFKKQSLEPESDVPAPAMGLPSVRIKKEVPAIYASADTTPLVVEIPEEGGEVNIEIKSKP